MSHNVHEDCWPSDLKVRLPRAYSPDEGSERRTAKFVEVCDQHEESGQPGSNRRHQLGSDPTPDSGEPE
jgi:hypothetical protein